MSSIVSIVSSEDLTTYDPYDIWKTRLGYRVKDLYNRNPFLGMVPAAVLAIVDLYANDRIRLGYVPQEYPIARAWAALILLNEYERNPDSRPLESAVRHLEWLTKHSCDGYSGPCWGLAFDYAVSADFQYDANTPLTTMTPYALEAFIRYTELTGNRRFEAVIEGIYRFLDNDIPVIEETDEYLVTAYSTLRDRRVVNAVSYVMYSYALLLSNISDVQRGAAKEKLRKLLGFVLRSQQEDGSWFYSPDGQSFIDCFHSCIVLKNLIKTRRILALEGIDASIDSGYRYLKESFFDAEKKLFRRFSIANKPGLIKFDLYDNAEMLNLAYLMGDRNLVRLLRESIAHHFTRGGTIFSQIDRWNFLHRPNTLRWAVLPYLYGLSVTASVNSAKERSLEAPQSPGLIVS